MSEEIAQVIHYYYEKAKEFTSEDNFSEWLNTLPEPIKSNFRNKGYQYSRTALPYLRFVAELNDLGLEEYIRENVSDEHYKEWRLLNHL